MDGKTLDQRRAQHAWDAAQRASNLKDAADYAREAKRFPVRIQVSGLGQALAFVHSKAGKDSHDARSQLLVDIANWTLKERKISGSKQEQVTPRSLIGSILEGDSRQMMRTSEEVLLYMQWLVRFCDSEIQIDQTADR